MVATNALDLGRRIPGRRESEGATALSDKMPRLVLEARRVSSLLAHGLHGRRRAGPGESFWQFRPFVTGEAAARVDWRRSARDDRLYVREREWEAAHNIWLWIDRALILGLGLADAFVEGGERVGLLGLTRATASRGIVERLAQALVADKAGLTQDLPPRASPARFDEVVLIGDFLTAPDRIADSVQSLAGRGSRGHLLMIVDPIEETFPFTGQAVLHDLEGSLSLDIGDADAWGTRYRARIAEHRAALAAITRGQGWTLTIHRTDRPASEAALRLATLIAARGTE
jgi:uncharacterized protein (DUF58 family)